MNSFDFLISNNRLNCSIWIVNNELLYSFMRNFHLCWLLRSNIKIIRILDFVIVYIQWRGFCLCRGLIIHYLYSINIWIWTDDCLQSTHCSLKSTWLGLNRPNLYSLGDLLLNFSFNLLLTQNWTEKGLINNLFKSLKCLFSIHGIMILIVTLLIYSFWLIF